ncbi:MAG: TauD/TfdA family dioxygenase, partial [Pseudomonadota bacterium]|nr:TauD/TfdA family dioxygenase [Pseudomonadota bacterium]
MLKIDRSQSISNLGARITGIDISKDIKSQDKELLKSLWCECSVLIFPNQKLHHKDFERFSLIFGEFGEDPFIDSIDNHPNIIEVKKEAN